MTTLYTPYKAIGYVCDSNPFVINRLGEEIFITTSIGTSFQVYRFNKLVSCMISTTTPGTISCFQILGQDTFVAVKNAIVVYNRSNIVRTYQFHQHNILGMIFVGNNLLSYDSNNSLKVICLIVEAPTVLIRLSL